MSIVICENGHVYDNDKFSNCPQCGIKSKTYESAFNSNKIRQVVIKKNTNPNNDDTDVKTVSIRSDIMGNNYVTGWIVCFEGPEIGRDYRLHYGFNRIGRSPDMDICISDDYKISRENHCSIVYDNRSNKFFICQGKGTITYLNDNLISSACELNIHDVIAMGESKFEFIPFCREGRIWE